MLHYFSEKYTQSTDKKENLKTNYSVYIYHKDDTCAHLPKWKKVGATQNGKRAMKHAYLLHKSKKYEKVEVKKRFYCYSEKRMVGKTVRTHESEDSYFDSMIKALAG